MSRAKQIIGDILALVGLTAAAVALLGFSLFQTGCMSTTVKFGPDGKVSEIRHANLMRVGTAIVHAPEGGGADVSTTAQGMSDELADVMKAGIEKAPELP